MTAGAGTGLVATAVTPIDTAAPIEGETPPRATTGWRPIRSRGASGVSGANLITVEEHLAHVLADAHPLAAELVPVDTAYARVLASDVVCVSPSPPFDNSAMDGYAVRRADLLDAVAAFPVRLPVEGEAAAGSAPLRPLRPGTAARIMTGAAVPDGADAVVPVERTLEARWTAERVTLAGVPGPGANIRRRGEDLAVGETVVRAGTLMSPYDVAAAIAAGAASVHVRSRPRVAVITTGDELRRPGTELQQGAIHDANGPLVEGLAIAAGAVVVGRRRVGDGPGALDRALKETFDASPDVIVLTGGVGPGAHDPVRRLDLAFASVAMQPGKPQAFGRIGGCAVFGLPGNPVAAAVSFEAFVLPLLRTLHGLPAEPEKEDAVAEERWTSSPGRRQYMPVVSRRVNGTLHVRPATERGSGSHLIGRLARADGYAVVPEEVAEIAAGDHVTVMRRA